MLFFGREIYTPEIVLKCLKIAGFNLNEEEILRIGKKIYANKYSFKINSGFDIENLTLPKRVFETPSSNGLLDKDFSDRAITLLKENIKSLL